MPPKRSIRIDINEKWCKKCGICIAFCPEKVFDNKGGMPLIRDLSACTGCLQCELLCPDFAIEVHITREEQP